MAVTLDQLKNYLRVDIDDDDALLTHMLATARDYLTGAVSKFDEYYTSYEDFARKADLLQMILVAEFYQNRDNETVNFSYTAKSLIAQLQFFTSETGTGNGTSNN